MATPPEHSTQPTEHEDPSSPSHAVDRGRVAASARGQDVNVGPPDDVPDGGVLRDEGAHAGDGKVVCPTPASPFLFRRRFILLCSTRTAGTVAAVVAFREKLTHLAQFSEAGAEDRDLSQQRNFGEASHMRTGQKLSQSAHVERWHGVQGRTPGGAVGGTAGSTLHSRSNSPLADFASPPFTTNVCQRPVRGPGVLHQACAVGEKSAERQAPLAPSAL